MTYQQNNPQHSLTLTPANHCHSFIYVTCAGCKPNAHIRNSQQRDDRDPGFVNSKLELFTRGGGKQTAAQEIRWEDCNLPVPGFGKGQLLSACCAACLPA